MNSFNYKNYKSVVLPVNEKTKKKWDLDETKGFVDMTIRINSFGGGGGGGADELVYKVINGRDKTLNNKVLHYIYLLDKYLFVLKKELLENFKTLPHEIQSGAEVLIKTPHSLQEIPANNSYEGVNKPKSIVTSLDVNGDPIDDLSFALDNDVRSGCRHIMLHLRDASSSGGSKNKLRNWNNVVKKLFIHELAHSMCNHCRYREEENHSDDFDLHEGFLLDFVSSNKNLKDVEKEINSKLF